MHVISRKALLEASRKYPDAEAPLDAWYRTAKRAKWENLTQVRHLYPHADPYGTCTIFNIKGNDYRLITKIFYDDQVILIRAVLTHAEDDKEGWKDDCTC